MIRKLLYILLFVSVFGLIALPFFLIDSEPMMHNTTRFNASEIDRAKSLLKRNDPRQLDSGEIVTQWIDEEEISLISGYLLSQIGGGAVSIELHPGRAYSQLTIRLPENPIGRYLNFSLVLSQWSNVLAIESLSLGRVTIPGWLAELIKNYSHNALNRIPEYQAAMKALNGLQILEDRMLVIYQWQPDLVEQIKNRGREIVVDEDIRARLLAYSRQIAAVSENPSLSDEVSLTEFLTPLFVLAQARREDPVEENRAALLALSFYFSGVDIARMMGIQIPQKKLVSKRMTLSGRYDFTQHFLTSAALSLTAGVGFADTIGLFKELDDAKGGSGFSFTDLGADRAGVRMAEFAIADRDSALRLQEFMTGSVVEEDFVPDFLDLPELLPSEEFEKEYGGVGGVRYNKILADIEQRLDVCRLYQ